MNNLSFIMEYMLRPRTVGAVIPSTKYLAERMIDQPELKEAKYIIEYGAGTGAFTEKIINHMGENTILLIVESNKKFSQILEKKYGNEPNVIIINGTVENICNYLENYNVPYANYVFSGLPFTSLPENVTGTILEQTKKILSEDGRFITFQYTNFKKNFISKFFKEIEVTREFRNLPPAYVYLCSN